MPIIYLIISGLLILLGAVLLGIGIDLEKSIFIAPGIVTLIYGIVASIWVAVKHWGID